MVKGIIFDMDGVISDTQKLHAEVEERLLRIYGIKMVAKELTQKYAGMSDKEFFETIFKESGKIDVRKVIKEKWKILITYAKDKIKAIDGAIDLIKKLKKANFKLAVASSSKREFVEFVLTELNIKEYFNVIVSGDEVKLGKPNPEIFLLVAKKLGISPKECVVIEDGEVGIIAAKNAGMSCIRLVNDSNKSEHADVVVKSLNEILRYVKIS